MFMSFSIFIIALYVITYVGCIQISTPQGDAKGIVMKSANGREFHAFLGIPFAKPPVGDLRLRDPVPFGNWTGVKDLSNEGSLCIQGELKDTGGVFGSEDCLYLNIYTPNAFQSKKYPVLVFIHGGGFTAGGRTTEYYGPEFLLDKDIILITISYRIGALGFASTEDSELPGNYGLKDQALALKWVQENVAAYGGNPHSVTVMGQSAGGASVHYHMISPLSKGLFHRAIPMSGSSHCPWALSPPGIVAERTKKLATLLGCSPNSSSTFIADCLRTTSADKFITVTKHFLEWDIDPVVIFTPVVEPKEIKDAFLTEIPYNIETDIPMMTGITTDEGSLRIALFQRTGGIDLRTSQLNKQFDKIGPLTLVFDRTRKNSIEAANKVKKFYFGEKEINEESIQSLINMYSDSWFMQCTASAVRSHKGPAYLYVFSYRGKNSFTDFLSPGNVSINYGVCHCDELMYLLPLGTYIQPSRHHEGKDKKMSEEMISLWTNFVIHGNPTPPGSKVHWDTVSKNRMNYLQITQGNSKMKDGFYSDRESFWRNIRADLEPTQKIEL